MSPIMQASLDRRRFLQGALATVGLAAVGGTLTACSPSASSSGPSAAASGGSTGTIDYWDWYVSQAPWVDNEIKLFSAASGITVKKTTQVSDKYADLFGLAQRSESLPPVFMIPKAPAIQEQVAKGWLLPLDDFIDDKWKARWPEGSFVEGVNTFGGKTYTAQFAGIAPSQQIYIHNGVFKAAGLTNADGTVKLPKTWDDVTNAAAAIKSKAGGNVYPFGFGNNAGILGAWWLDMFARGAGSPGGCTNLDYRVGKYTYASDRNYADAMELFLEWKTKEYIHPNVQSMSDEQARALFAKGEFGMTIGGVWNQPQWKTDGFTDYSMVTLPSTSGSPKAFFYGAPGSGFVGISAAAKDPEAAFKWFDWLYSVDAGKRWVEQEQGLSVFPENNDPSGIKFAPFAQYVAMADMAKYGPAPTIRNPDVAKVSVDAVVPGVNDVATGIFTGQLGDVSAALTDLQDRSQAALEAGIKTAKGAGANVSIDDYKFTDWDPTQTYITKPKSA